jgi:hypothetical protein
MKNIIKYSVLGVISILFISGMLTASANGWHASIGDYVWHDLNHDGIQYEEPGIPGVVVNLYKCNGDFVYTTTTDSNGFYLFYYLDPGDYYLEFIAPDGYVITLQDQGEDDSIDSDSDGNGKTMCTTLDSYEHDMTWDAGMYMPEEYEGCTPGFWKNLKKHGGEWTDYSPDDDYVGGIFILPSEFSDLNVSLIDALKFGGGNGKIGMARNLIRAAVAGILNEAHPYIIYPEYDVIGQVNTALTDAADESDVEIARGIMETLKDTLDAANNLGSDVCC